MSEIVNECRLERFIERYVGGNIEEAKKNCYYVKNGIYVFKKRHPLTNATYLRSTSLSEELFYCGRWHDGGDFWTEVLDLPSDNEDTPVLLDLIINSSHEWTDIKILAERIIWCLDALGSKIRISAEEKDYIVEKLLMFMKKHPDVSREWWQANMIAPWKDNKYFMCSGYMLKFLWESEKLKAFLADEVV
jgi:hypothetical protein